MRFRSDDQRKAVFANMMYPHMNKFAADPFKAMSEDIEEASKFKVEEPKSLGVPLKLPEGTQSVYLVRDFGSNEKTKAAAREALNILRANSSGISYDVVPLWEGGEKIGDAIVMFKREARGVNIPSEGPSTAESARVFPIEEPERIPIEKIRYVPTPKVSAEEQFLTSMGMTQADAKSVVDKDTRYMDLENQLLAEGVSSERVSKSVDTQKKWDEGEQFALDQAEYYKKLLAAFEASGLQDFERFKEKYNATYKGKKFSRKKDYSGIYQRNVDEYVCSYCGDGFGNRTVAAIHAAKCDDNPFNDEECDFGEDDDSPNDSYSI